MEASEVSEGVGSDGARTWNEAGGGGVWAVWGTAFGTEAGVVGGVGVATGAWLSGTEAGSAPCRLASSKALERLSGASPLPAQAGA